MKKQPNSLPSSKRSYVGWLLGAASLSMSALAVWQWLELIKVRQGGSAVCAVSEAVNCEKVWETAFAHGVQAKLGLPIAAFGLVWGLGALLWAASLGFNKTQEWRRFCTWGTQVWALAGALSCLVFAYVSWQAASVCLSCLATFVLVLVYAFFAFSLLPRVAFSPKPFFWALLLCLALVAFFGALLQPFGKKTALPAGFVPGGGASFPGSLKQFLEELSPKEREAVARARKAFLAAPSLPAAAPTVGRSPREAPVVLLEFTDIQCPHCMRAEMLLKQLLHKVPAGSLAVEPRYFPLEPGCNSVLRKPEEPPPAEPFASARCAAALAQICLEGTAEFAKLRGELFQAAGRLHTRAELLAFLRGKTPSVRLEACMELPQTLERLQADIALAVDYQIPGTPAFVLNGKPVGFVPSFWVAMALAKGNAGDLAFEVLHREAAPHASP